MTPLLPVGVLFPEDRLSSNDFDNFGRVMGVQVTHPGFALGNQIIIF
jgi:hypothetical protein